MTMSHISRTLLVTSSRLQNVVKVLGVKWKPLEDQLVCDLSALLHDIASVKLNLSRGKSLDSLRGSMTLYPVTIQFKIFFQDICAARLK